MLRIPRGNDLPTDVPDGLQTKSYAYTTEQYEEAAVFGFLWYAPVVIATGAAIYVMYRIAK
jgi:hypothetical protein